MPLSTHVASVIPCPPTNRELPRVSWPRGTDPSFADRLRNPTADRASRGIHLEFETIRAVSLPADGDCENVFSVSYIRDNAHIGNTHWKIARHGEISIYKDFRMDRYLSKCFDEHGLKWIFRMLCYERPFHFVCDLVRKYETLFYRSKRISIDEVKRIRRFYLELFIRR